MAATYSIETLDVGDMLLDAQCQFVGKDTAVATRGTSTSRTSYK